MKTYKVIYLFALLLVLIACSPAQAQVTSSPIPQITYTAIPTSTATPLPTPTFALPVRLLTPVPNQARAFTANVLDDLEQVAFYQGQPEYLVKQTPDEQYLFILDGNGVEKYRVADNQRLFEVRLRSFASLLEVSDDGRWALIDGGRLVDFGGEEPLVITLSEHVVLQPFYTEYALSPDGSKILINQRRCINLCEFITKLVSTSDFSVLYHDAGFSVREAPSFSPDSQLFALVSQPQVVTANGGTSRTGGHLVIWDANTAENVGSVQLSYPFSVMSYDFSSDGERLAFSQATGVYIYDWRTREVISSYQMDCAARKIGYASDDRLFESSTCGSFQLSESEGKLVRQSKASFDFEHFVFPLQHVPKLIKYPYPAAATFAPYSNAYYFDFSTEGTLIFGLRDQETYENLTCTTLIDRGQINCVDTPAITVEGKTLYTRNLLGTDHRMYAYQYDQGEVLVFPSGDSTPLLSIPFTGGAFQLLGLNPESNTAIYYALGGINPGVGVYNYLEDRWLARFERGSAPEVVFSQDNRYAAICLRQPSNTFNTGTPVDDLYVFDLIGKETVRKIGLDCSSVAVALSPDGESFAVQEYIRDAEVKPGGLAVRTQLFFTGDSTKRIVVDIESQNRAVIFSPDSSLLIASCGSVELCFVDTLTGEVLKRVESQPYINKLAFSLDGGLLAVLSRTASLSFWAIQ